MAKIPSDNWEWKEIRQGHVERLMVVGGWKSLWSQGECVCRGTIRPAVWVTGKSQSWKDLGQDVPGRGSKIRSEGVDVAIDLKRGQWLRDTVTPWGGQKDLQSEAGGRVCGLDVSPNAWKAIGDFKYRIVMLGYICFSKIILAAAWKIDFSRVRMKAGTRLGDLALTQAREDGCLS